MRPNEVIQPAREIMRQQQIRIDHAAEQMGVSYRHLRYVLRGITAPMDAVREQLPVILGVPLVELFTPELLARSYDPRFVWRSQS